MSDTRVGFGYDVHRFSPNSELVLGGIHIPHEKGLRGHSDADVLLHAIMDAMLGAAALGDIGTHFPDTDPQYENADSRDLLRDCRKLLLDKGYEISNLDATIVTEQPKLIPYIDKMRNTISEDLRIEVDRVSVKATTSEKMGFIGREEGISAAATVLIDKRSE